MYTNIFFQKAYTPILNYLILQTVNNTVNTCWIVDYREILLPYLTIVDYPIW